MINGKNLNPDLLRAEYAVRGPIVNRAQQMEAEGKKIIYANIGNPQALKQKPLTYVRQVLSLIEYPALIGDSSTARLFPEDIVEKARMMLERHPFGTGAYSQSAGIPFIRQACAEFIQRRDGIPTRADSIILTDGASKGVQATILALLKNPHDGFMIPIPQYPLYSATISLYGGRQIGYYLDEENQWQLKEEMLVESITPARTEGINPVAIAVINPGNPTGAVLSAENIQMIIRFARTEGLAILADEVYQENIYAPDRKFHSFARVMHEMGEKEVSLFSFHSTSKGFLGECGHRGGYTEIRNVPDDVLAELVKLQSISLCANLPGQFLTYLMVAPPQSGDDSHAQYVRERDGILADLKAKAELLGREINSIGGMSVDVPQGAMYAFVKFTLPPARDKQVAQMSPAQRREFESRRDEEYCMALLEETGICVVPGSGFGQSPGTLHFRTTFLPPLDEIVEFVRKLRIFHERYVGALATT